ncbi:uncharacterized protein LOC130913390 [Corythoichthys intestinalis]|uniref:uncharacterized protein LOC130913390 n=1 Tax=Corythoichthys intestinalis TaxID=161448 RepID=UPI0025A5D169|nr:uncharacterized protein LOC130913390 [Corythoichthys intestinalis]
MLKELVRERLIAAADEIFELFERAIASYEEQLCRAREENERHRRQLEAVSKTQTVTKLQDIQPPTVHQEEPSSHLQSGSSSLSPHIKEENVSEPRFIKQENNHLDISELPLTGVPMESEDEDEPHRRISSGDLLAPLSDTDDDDNTEEQTTPRQHTSHSKPRVGVRAGLRSPASDTSFESQSFPSTHYNTDSENKRKFSAVWDHFELISPVKVKCRICSTKLSYVNKSTSSMLRHFRARHTHEDSTNTPKIAKVSRKHALDQAVLNFLIKESQPVSIVESDSFRELLQAIEPSYVLPTKKIVNEMGSKIGCGENE